MMTSDKLDVNGKRVIVRADLNSPLENRLVVLNPRFYEHAKTIKQLSEKGAKLIVLSHQGRKGDHDFISLEQHAKLLENLIGKKIHFVNDIIGEKAKSAIKQLQNGDILLLDNVRLLEDEETEHPHKATIVAELSKLADIFVLDAFSIAHRKHASIIGFMYTLPSCSGPVLSKEIKILKHIEHGEKITFIIGGSKIHDSYLLIKKWLELGRIEKALLAGIPGILSLHAHDHKVGPSYKHLEKLHMTYNEPELKAMIQKHSNLIRHPVDVALDEGGKRKEVDITEKHVETIKHEIKDIGKKTMEIFKEEIKKAKIIIMNGSPGVYEEEQFAEGTKVILQAIAESNAFSIIGGGHTITAIEKFHIPKEKFGYVSLSGKAFLEYLEGRELPALKALDENEKIFFK